MLTTLVLLVYAALFVCFAWRSGLKQWVLAAGILAAATVWLLVNVLPGMVYQHSVVVLYLLPLCLTASSLFFFANQWRYHSARQVFYVEPPCSSYLAYLAVSGMMLHLAALVLCLLLALQYPDGLSFYGMMGLLQLYFLQPLYWILVQWVLMLILYLAQKWHRTPLLIISVGQLQFAFLFGLLAIAMYVGNDLLHYVRPQ